MNRVRTRVGRVVLGLVVLLALVACSPSHHAIVEQFPPTSGTELPLRFVYNLPITDVRIGDDVVALIVDVGGHDTITLERDAVDRLAPVYATGKRAASSRLDGSRSFDREIIVPDMRIGGDVVLRDVEGHEIDLGGPVGLEGAVDGYLGAAILTRFSLLVDYPDRMVLYPPGARPPGFDEAAWIRVPIDTNRASPAVLADRPIVAGWDTGASHMIISPTHARRLGGGQSSEPISAMIELAGHPLGPFELHVRTLQAARFDVLIGHAFFVRHRVFFEFTDGVVWVKRPG